MPKSNNCIFCQIVTGGSPATYVHQDEDVVAFLDINPVTPGHLLVVPRLHAPSLSDLSDDLASRMFAVARQLAATLRASGLRCDGVNLFYADGEAAFQEVLHSHIHVIPRFAGDGFSISANWGSHPTRDELDVVGAQIRPADGH
jgi:histidine triad (HIT) family protein